MGSRKFHVKIGPFARAVCQSTANTSSPIPSSRHRWTHAIRREDVHERRMAVTLRELGPDFTGDGGFAAVGNELLTLAETFAGEPVGAAS